MSRFELCCATASDCRIGCARLLMARLFPSLGACTSWTETILPFLIVTWTWTFPHRVYSDAPVWTPVAYDAGVSASLGVDDVADDDVTADETVDDDAALPMAVA